MSVARVYRDINVIRPVSYWDYTSLQIPWGYSYHYLLMLSSTANYIVIEKVGRGKYSDCYRGICTSNGRECCIKVIKPIKMRKIQRLLLVSLFIVGKSKSCRICMVVLTSFQYSYWNCFYLVIWCDSKWGNTNTCLYISFYSRYRLQGITLFCNIIQGAFYQILPFWDKVHSFPALRGSSCFRSPPRPWTTPIWMASSTATWSRRTSFSSTPLPRRVLRRRRSRTTSNRQMPIGATPSCGCWTGVWRSSTTLGRSSTCTWPRATTSLRSCWRTCRTTTTRWTCSPRAACWGRW